MDSIAPLVIVVTKVSLMSFLNSCPLLTLLLICRTNARHDIYHWPPGRSRRCSVGRFLWRNRNHQGNYLACQSCHSNLISFIPFEQMDKRTNKPKIWIYKDKMSGKGKGEATVTYDDPPTANSAISWFNGKHQAVRKSTKLLI